MALVLGVLSSREFGELRTGPLSRMSPLPPSAADAAWQSLSLPAAAKANDLACAKRKLRNFIKCGKFPTDCALRRPLLDNFSTIHMSQAKEVRRATIDGQLWLEMEMLPPHFMAGSKYYASPASCPSATPLLQYNSRMVLRFASGQKLHTCDACQL